MLAREPSEIARAWRDRLAGRSRFDQDVAALAIDQAYQRADLAPPGRVIWADGPHEAMRAVAFLRTPPGVLWRFAKILAVAGAVIWLGLTLTISRHLLSATADGDWITFAVTLSAFCIILGGLRPVPVPPKINPVPRHREILAWVAAIAIIAVQPIFCSALLRLDRLDTDPATLAAALALAAAVGSLPGLLLAARIYAVYRVLPPHLQSIGPGMSVGWQVRRARNEVWAPFQHLNRFAPWSDQLPNQRLNAHALAFRDVSTVGFLTATQPRAVSVRGRTGANLLSVWLARLFDPLPGIEAPSQHLDGIEDAGRAVAAERAGATGDALCFAQIAFNLDRLYPFRDIAVAVRPAIRVALDGEDRLHSDRGPALAWRDGTAVYMWHGQPVDADLVDDGTPLSRSLIELEFDANRRRVLIERYGLGRYMMECGAGEIQRDRCGAIYWLDQRFDEPIVAVRVVNHTPHPDGSFEEFWLRVPPSMQTAREAVAWTFGLSPEEYDPLLES